MFTTTNQRMCLVNVAWVVSLLITGCVTQRGDRVIRAWETANKTFKIRVNEYDEQRSIVLPHYYYRFEGAGIESNGWQEIMTVRTDEDIEIPKDQVRFVNDRVGYLFMLGKYAVTTDSGNSWQVWDSDQSAPNHRYPNERFIKEVNVNSDGNGTIQLASRSDPKDTIELRTNDYGVSWK